MTRMKEEPPDDEGVHEKTRRKRRRE